MWYLAILNFGQNFYIFVIQISPNTLIPYLIIFFSIKVPCRRVESLWHSFIWSKTISFARNFDYSCFHHNFHIKRKCKSFRIIQTNPTWLMELFWKIEKHSSYILLCRVSSSNEKKICVHLSFKQIPQSNHPPIRKPQSPNCPFKMAHTLMLNISL